MYIYIYIYIYGVYIYIVYTYTIYIFIKKKHYTQITSTHTVIIRHIIPHYSSTYNLRTYYIVSSHIIWVCLKIDETTVARIQLCITSFLFGGPGPYSSTNPCQINPREITIHFPAHCQLHGIPHEMITRIDYSQYNPHIISPTKSQWILRKKNPIKSHYIPIKWLNAN